MGFFETIESDLIGAVRERALRGRALVLNAAGLAKVAKGNADGHVYAHATGARRSAGALTPGAATYDPPLRLIYATAAGTATVVLAGDTATTTFPIVLEANAPTTLYEIAQVVSLTGGGTLYGAA